MGYHVLGAVIAVQLQLAGLVVHGVGAGVHAGGLRAKRVHEGITDTAETGGLIGAARENDLGVGAFGGQRCRRQP